MSEKRLTRRTLLRSALVGGAGLVVAACQPVVVEKEVTVKEAVEVEKEVTRIIETQVEAPRKKVELRMAKFPGEAWKTDQIWCEKFDDENDNISVTVEEVLYGEMSKKCLALGATGLLWDVFAGHNKWMPFLGYKGVTLAYDDLLDTYGIWVDDFFPSAIADARSMGTDGKLMWFPTCVHPGGQAVIAFNDNLMADAGVSLPEGAEEGDWTIADLEEIVRGASKPHEIFGIHLPSIAAPHYGTQVTRTWGSDPDVGSEDAWLYSRDGKKLQMSDDFPRVKAGYEWCHNFAKDGISPNLAELKAVAGTSYFVAEKQVTNVGLVSLPMHMAVQVGDKFPISFAQWPKGPNGHRGSCLSYNTMAVYSKSKAPVDAFRLSAYLTAPEPSLFAGTEAPLHAYARRSAWFSPQLWEHANASPGGGKQMEVAAKWFDKGVDPFPQPWNLRFMEVLSKAPQETELYRQGEEPWDEMVSHALPAIQAILDKPRP